MDEKDVKNLSTILEYAVSIIEETKSIKNDKSFMSNNDKSKAALFDLLQIGELANKLSREYVLSSPISWSEIYGLRNRIVHGYADVDYTIIWQTIKKDIPKLVKELNKILK